jgi:hypothetical protein
MKMFKMYPKNSNVFVKRNGSVHYLTTSGLQELTQVFSGNYTTVKIEGKSVAVHRIVAETYLEEPLSTVRCPVVDHIDGDRRNNRASNLQWISQAQNLAKGKRRTAGRYEVIATRGGISGQFESIRSAALELGITPTYLSQKFQLESKICVCGYELTLVG